jgi:hypothetical protein
MVGIRGVVTGLGNACQLVRTTTGWPKLPENPKDGETSDQSALDADLGARLQGYFNALGPLDLVCCREAAMDQASFRPK